MSDTAVSVLTPPGAGAIATVEVAGPQAWEMARQLFILASGGRQPPDSRMVAENQGADAPRSPGRTLPESPQLHRFWFGKLADGDEVVLAMKSVDPPRIEVHCHGGRRVVQWVVDQFLASRERQRPEEQPLRSLTLPARQLIQAPTLRTAAILLDQYHGAFDRAIRDPDQLAELSSWASLGRHLVEPWKVAVAGPPNVGKSSLINALAGYQRSVVSETAGTTRDVVTVQVAFDGWPVELADTAGLRASSALGSADSASRLNLDPVEAEGLALADRYIRAADLVLWVVDAGAPLPDVRGNGLVVINKIDQPAAWDRALYPDAIRVSALTGEGIAGLAAAIARALVPRVPPPGAAVPYTPQLADLVERASRDEAIAFIEQAKQT
ncbi:MAG TPA: GTPase [Urbifossiella sp.]|nr:GTPase [Urbifossiella sp.]